MTVINVLHTVKCENKMAFYCILSLYVDCFAPSATKTFNTQVTCSYILPVVGLMSCLNL